jgi:diadenosine tetraphosphate (Ap4A) HIT family hydrolase
MALPETAHEFYARVLAFADAEGRLPVADDQMAGWDIFPYEVDSLRLKPLRPLRDDEYPRAGEDPDDCSCAKAPDDSRLVWANERWRLLHTATTGLPLMMLLDPVAHHDLNDLTPELAAEMGVLMVSISVAMERLPSIGRAHIQKLGDGGAHLHLWFMGRPALTDQFLGSPLVDWEESFPRVPEEVLRANAGFVATELVAAVGGRVGPYGAPDEA